MLYLLLEAGFKLLQRLCLMNCVTVLDEHAPLLSQHESEKSFSRLHMALINILLYLCQSSIHCLKIITYKSNFVYQE